MAISFQGGWNMSLFGIPLSDLSYQGNWISNQKVLMELEHYYSFVYTHNIPIMFLWE